MLFAWYKWDFFIAHTSADKKLAEELYGYLHSRSRVFLDSQSIKPGDDWDREIASAQNRSRITVILISSKSAFTYYQREEIATAIYLARTNPKKHRVVPVFLNKEARLGPFVPYGLRIKQSLTISSDLPLKSLAEKLLQLLAFRSYPRYAKLQQRSMPNSEVLEKNADDIALSLSVMEIIYSDIFSYGDDIKLQYEADKSQEIISITSSMDYLSDHNNENRIRPLMFSVDSFQWDFPNLDLKIVNNSGKTIFLTEIVLEIEESRLDPSPLLVIDEDCGHGNALHFCIKNAGWGDAKNLKVKFHINPVNAELIFTGPFPYEILLGDISDCFNLDITEALRHEGVDFDQVNEAEKKALQSLDHLEGRDFLRGMEMKFERFRDLFYRENAAWLGRFPEGSVTVSGELEFEGPALDKKNKQYHVRFATIVHLYNNISAGGGPISSSGQYTTKFQTEGENYKRRIGISHVLKPLEADRFNIKIGLDKSSQHRFRMKIIYNNEKELELPEILLTAFVPKITRSF